MFGRFLLQILSFSVISLVNNEMSKFGGHFLFSLLGEQQLF